jgi:hypothetical protein
VKNYPMVLDGTLAEMAFEIDSRNIKITRAI